MVLDVTTTETHSRINNYKVGTIQSLADDVSDTETRIQSIADWASAAHDSYADIVNVLSGVCLVGAGLTYTAIFRYARVRHSV